MGLHEDAISSRYKINTPCNKSDDIFAILKTLTNPIQKWLLLIKICPPSNWSSLVMEVPERPPLVLRSIPWCSTQTVDPSGSAFGTLQVKRSLAAFVTDTTFKVNVLSSCLT